MAPRTRLRWSPNLVRVALAGHSLLGLVFGAVVYQVCLTGTVSVFSADLKRWEQPNAPVVDAVSPEGYAAAAAGALARAGAVGKTIVLFGPTDARPRFEVRVPGAGENALADREGSVVGGVSTPWTELVVSLHEELHLPYPWGALVIALTGAILLALVINGLCAHPRIFRDAFHLRLGGAPRLSEADIHNRLSVWGLPFHIAVTLTGTILALAGVLGPLLLMLSYAGDIDRGLREVLGPQPSYQHMEPAPLPDIAGLIRQVEARAPAKVSFIEIQQAGTAGQVLRIDTGAPGHLANGESYVFSGEGAALGSVGYSDGPAAKQLIAALTPLHYGTFAGLPIRLIYGGLGLALCAICATGVNIWLIRRRESGARYAAWTRTWIAVVWGQPIALAGAALAPAGIGPLLPYVTITTTTLLLLAAVPMAAVAVRTWMRFATAAALVALAADNVLEHGTLPADGKALHVNAALIGGGVLLAWRLRPPPKRAEPQVRR
jgi:uncharacterized iron-regulated membrane protein